VSNSQRLAEISADLLQPDVPPQTARAHLVTLTVLWGDLRQTALEAELIYKVKLRDYGKEHKTASKAAMEAEATLEYAKMRRAAISEEWVLELIRSCKKALSSISDEMRMV
jgi:hypothetical protein